MEPTFNAVGKRMEGNLYLFLTLSTHYWYCWWQRKYAGLTRNRKRLSSLSYPSPDIKESANRLSFYCLLMGDSWMSGDVRIGQVICILIYIQTPDFYFLFLFIFLVVSGCLQISMPITLQGSTTGYLFHVPKFLESRKMEETVER